MRTPIRNICLTAAFLFLSAPAWAGLSAKVGTFAQPNSTGNQSITGVGFQPKIVLFWMSAPTGNGSAANVQWGQGVATSSSNRLYFSSSADNNVTNYTGERRATKTSCIGLVAVASATVTVEADFVSMDSDGFTVNWTTVDATARIITYLALGGDLSSANVGTFDTTANSTGNKSITGVGFKPDCVLLIPTGIATSWPVLAGNNTRPGLGMMTASDQGVSSVSWPGAAAALNISKSVQATNEVAENVTVASGSNSSHNTQASYVSMDSDGFTINITHIEATGTSTAYIALKGGRFKIGSFNQATSTGNQVKTGIGFQPVALLMTSINKTTNNAAIQAPATLSLGIGVSGSSEAITISSTSTSSPTSASSDIGSTQIIKMMTAGGASPTTQAAATLSSLDTDGWTLNWGTADATAREIIYLAIGSNSIKTINGLAKASVKTVNGLAVGSVKTWDGLP